MALPMVLMEVNIPCVGGALLVGIYLRYLAANLRYLVLLIRGDLLIDLFPKKEERRDYESEASSGGFTRRKRTQRVRS